MFFLWLIAATGYVALGVALSVVTFERVKAAHWRILVTGFVVALFFSMSIAAERLPIPVPTLVAVILNAYSELLVPKQHDEWYAFILVPFLAQWALIVFVFLEVAFVRARYSRWAQRRTEMSSTETKRRSIRTVYISIIVICIMALGLVLRERTRTIPSDCDVARRMYKGSEEIEFGIFLEERFRVFGIVDTPGWFTDPIYELGIARPGHHGIKYKHTSYAVALDGSFYSRRAISISENDWKRGRRVRCEQPALRGE
jgi:magnesium-transporting ATPase (P-type)